MQSFEGAVHSAEQKKEISERISKEPGLVSMLDVRKLAEHLDPGVKPIIACVGTSEQFEQYPGTEEEVFSGFTTNSAHGKNVDYFSIAEDLTRQNFKNAGYETYVISTVDGDDKFSYGFRNCTGIVVAGKDKTTGEEVSLMSHEDPSYFVKDSEGTDRFTKDLEERLREIAARCVEGTIDAAIFGGNYRVSAWDSESDKTYQENYLKSIEILTKSASEVLKFDPLVIVGPKMVGGGDTVFYDTKNRRLYISRPVVGDKATPGYKPSDISGQEKKWRA